MTQAHLDLHNQLEPSSSDLSTQPLFDDSPVLFLETNDQVNAHHSEQVEQTEHNTSSKVQTPPDTTNEVPPPPTKRYEIKKDPVFLSSPVFPPRRLSQPSLSTNRDDHLIPILSQDNFTIKAQLTSLYVHPTDYSFRLYDKNQNCFTSIASKILSPYQFWLENAVKNFSLQFKLLRPSIYDLKTDESDPSFLPLSQNASHHKIYTEFLLHTKPQNYLFVNYKYTSPFSMSHFDNIDHARITGYLRNYDPIKRYFWLLSYNDTSRPLLVPQEYLIHFDDFCCLATFLRE